MITKAFVWQEILLKNDYWFTFRLVKHPSRDFYQCTSQFRIEMISEITLVGGEPVFNFHGFEPETIYRIYNMSFFIFVFFLPLLIIIISYISIFYQIRRYNWHKCKWMTSFYCDEEKNCSSSLFLQHFIWGLEWTFISNHKKNLHP